MPEPSTNSYSLLATLEGQHTDTVSCMQFSPCGRYLVTGGDDLRMNVFDCTNEFENILSVTSTASPSAICWNPTKSKCCFVGYSAGAVVYHTFGKDSNEWTATILTFKGFSRIVSLAWGATLAVATERNVCLIKDIKPSELTSQHHLPSMRMLKTRMQVLTASVKPLPYRPLLRITDSLSRGLCVLPLTGV